MRGATAERLVVPSEGHVERLARQGVHAETRDALRARLFAALAPDVTPATAIEARVALAESMKGAARGDAALSSLAPRAWLRAVDAVEDALAELHAAGVLADDLDGAGGRAAVLAAAMRGTDARLARAGLLHPSRVASVLASVLSRAEPEDVRAAAGPGGGSFVADWCARWEPAEIAWWRAFDAQLSRTGGSAVIRALATVRPLDAEREASPLDRALDALAQALDDAPETRAARAPLGDMRMDGRLPRSETPVEVRRAADAAAQARAVADAIRAALDDGSGRGQLDLFAAGGKVGGAAAIDAVAIAVPRIDEETLAPIRRALADLGLPIREPRAALPSRSPALSTALSALSLGARGLSRLDVAALLRSPYVKVEGKLGVARALEQTPSARGDDAIDVLEKTAKGAGDIGRALAEADLARTRAEHAAAARRVFAALGLDGGVAPRARLFRSAAAMSGVAREEALAVARDQSAWAALTATIDAYDAAAARLGLADARLGGEAFRHELVRALDEEAAAPRASSAAAVRVATFEELAGEPLDLLVIVDANDGVLPSPAPSGPFLDAALAAHLRGKDPLRAPLSSSAREACDLVALAMAAENAAHIVVCHRDRDAAGAALAPAPLAAWLARAGATTSRWTAAPLSEPAVTESDARLLAAARAGRGGTSDAARRARTERAREAFFEIDNAVAGAVVGNLSSDGAVAAALEQALAQDTGGAARAMSVTSLEKIATCAFQGFAAQVLRAEARRPVGELPDAREGGTLLHGALAAAFQATEALWRARPRDAARIEAEAMRAADVVLRRDAHASGLRRLAIDRQREHVAAVVALGLADEEWDFFAAERRFGEPGGWPGLSIEDGATRISLRGSIDRVDRAARGGAVRVIDYKSSDSGAQSATKRLGDSALQVALYARVAAAALGVDDSFGLYLPASAKVLPLSARRLDAAMRAWARAEEDVEGRPRAVATALDVVRALRGGGLSPGPTDPGACERCSFDGGCRKPRFVIRGKAEDAPDAP